MYIWASPLGSPLSSSSHLGGVLSFVYWIKLWAVTKLLKKKKKKEDIHTVHFDPHTVFLKPCSPSSAKPPDWWGVNLYPSSILSMLYLIPLLMVSRTTSSLWAISDTLCGFGQCGSLWGSKFFKLLPWTYQEKLIRSKSIQTHLPGVLTLCCLV